MSSFSSPSPLAVSRFTFRRNPKSPSTEGYMHNLVPLSSFTPSSLPSLAPLALTRQRECTEWQVCDYLDDLDEFVRDRRNQVEDTCFHSCRAPSRYPLPCMHSPLPPLITKFATDAFRSDAPPPYSSSPSYSSPAYLLPQVDSTIAHDYEEYDLEGMDIHIRETYFATSAERGRWLSSPIPSHIRPLPTPPIRGHSSPVKPLSDTPSRQRLLRQPMSCSSSGQTLAPPLQDCDEDVRCLSPLPPSSPLLSPMSNLSFLNDDNKRDTDYATDLRSKSDDIHSLAGTPELSTSSTSCTSPVEFTRTLTQYEVPATESRCQSTIFSTHRAGSITSRHTSPCSPGVCDNRVPSSDNDATDFELDGILSPLSQFELDLPEADPPKLPLSDTVNKPHPGQMVSPGVLVDSAQDQHGSSSLRSLDFVLDAGGSGSNKRTKKRRPITGNTGSKQRGKRGDRRSKDPSSDAKKRGGASRPSNRIEPPTKRSKLSHSVLDLESQALARRDGVNRLSPSLSCPVVEDRDPEPMCVGDSKTPKTTSCAQPQQAISSLCATPVSMDTDNGEFHTSLTGMLVEALATSRATSMDASALYLVLTQAHPHLVMERPKGELLMDITVVLEAGRCRCGMFEKVDGSGERSRHKALESRWFYVPDKDDDLERASLISAIMPRQKRNETKKYKQYYYRPLDKMSRWDPEDAP